MAAAGSSLLPIMGTASAATDGPTLEALLDRSGTVTVPPGTYAWDGDRLEVGGDETLVGGGTPGATVWQLEDGTMEGTIEGRFRNVVVRGANPAPKAGIDLLPGAEVDGFVWPEGGQQDEDRALYTPDGGDERVVVRRSAWAWMANNGAYLDKPAVTIDRCAAVNNNIAGIRVGHRDGTDEDRLTHVKNSLIAVTREVASDDTNSANARGLRIRHPCRVLVENCTFVYLDVPGTADLIEIHDEAAGAEVTIRNCTFYNDSPGKLVRDKADGDAQVTLEGCTVAGTGNREVEPDVEGSGLRESPIAAPLPSQVTGYRAADAIDGVGPGIGPW